MTPLQLYDLRAMPQVLLAVQDFANGFLWGRLFSHFQLQPDFDKFDDKRTPDAMVNNFTRLQVCGLGGSSSTTTSWSRVRVMHAISCRIRTTEKADTDHMATQSLFAYLWQSAANIQAAGHCHEHARGQFNDA